MNTISYAQKGDSGNGRISEAEVQESIYPGYREVNITDGGEFLDDAIRMKDQPLEEKPIEENQQTKFQTNKIIYYEHY